VSAFNLNPTNLSLPIVNFVTNPDGFSADYKSLELGATKRFTNKWSMVGSFLLTWTSEYGTSYFGSGAGHNGGSNSTLFAGFASTVGFPITPNGQTERSEFTTWNFKIHGSYEPGWGLRFTPIYRMQQGYPYGRVFAANLNYGAQNFLAEPITTHRLQTIRQLDFRAEKKFKVTGRARLGVILDVYNVFNANTELNIRATTGRLTISETADNIATFNTPVTILPPRIVRLSARFDF
jgi:hypothetical protein